MLFYHYNAILKYLRLTLKYFNKFICIFDSNFMGILTIINVKKIKIYGFINVY
jgi:hypothetical protein